MGHYRIQISIHGSARALWISIVYERNRYYPTGGTFHTYGGADQGADRGYHLDRLDKPINLIFCSLLLGACVLYVRTCRVSRCQVEEVRICIRKTNLWYHRKHRKHNHYTFTFFLPLSCWGSTANFPMFSKGLCFLK